MGRSVSAEADTRKTNYVTCGRATGGTDSTTVPKHKVDVEKKKERKKGNKDRAEGSNLVYTSPTGKKNQTPPTSVPGAVRNMTPVTSHHPAFQVM